MLINKGFISKVATSFSLLFAVLLLLSLPGESADIVSPEESSLVPSSFSFPIGGFSYNAWRDSGKPIEEGNDWASGTFILKTPGEDLYRSRLSAAWREAAASALDITPLLHEQLLLHANDKDADTSATLGSYGDAALLNFVDTTTDGLLGGLLDSGRKLSWVKTLDGEFRAQAGDRPWSLGLGGILSLHERQDSAIGLQFYGNSGENSRGYSGLFYRQALGTEHLLGINSFVDYEEDIERNDDGFWRWTLGGEWRTSWLDLRANHYLGLTEGKIQSDGAYIYTADGSDIALNLHAPQAGWLSGELKYYQWDGQYGDADEEGIKYGIQVAPTGLSNLNFNIGYDNPLDGKGSWEGGFTWSHNFGESASSSGGGLRFNARDNFYQSSRSSDTSQRIRRRLPRQSALAFSPEGLDITLSYPVSNYLILANVNSFARGGLGIISYAVSSPNPAIDVALIEENSRSTHLYWNNLPTIRGNFVIPVVATDEGGDKATLQLNVDIESLRSASGALSVTLSYPVNNYLLLANVGSFFMGGHGNISYSASSNDVNLRANASGTNLWWSALPGSGNYIYNIVATDEAEAKATLQLNIYVEDERAIYSVQPTITVSYSLPLENYFILSNVDSLFAGGRGGYYDATISYGTEGDAARVVEYPNGGYDLYWNYLPATPGDIIIDVVATDHTNEGKSFLGLFDGDNETAVSRVIVKLESISAVHDSLDITLSLPLSDSLLLPDVASFFSGGRAAGTSYAVHPSNSVDVVLVDNVHSINLYWNTLPTRAGNVSIPVVATDTTGYKATLQLNVKTESINTVSGISSVTLSYPVSNYLILANVHDFFSDEIGRISYEVSSPNLVHVALGANGNGTHLWWDRLPTVAGDISVYIVATDEVGDRETLQLNVRIKSINAVPDILEITLSSLPLRYSPLLRGVESYFTGGRGAIGYSVSLPARSAVDARLVNNVNSTDLYWDRLPTEPGDPLDPKPVADDTVIIPIVATDEIGGKAVLLLLVHIQRQSIQATPDVLDITLSYPVSNYLILANVHDFFSDGYGRIGYTVSSPNSVHVALGANGNGTHLWWQRLPEAAGGFGVEIVATDEADGRATLLLLVHIQRQSIQATPDVLDITLSYPVSNYLILANVHDFFSDGYGRIGYTVSSPNSVHVALGANGNGTHLWWQRLPEAAGGFGVEIVATDEADGRATLRVNMKIKSISAVSEVTSETALIFTPENLDITLSYPVSNYLILANVNEFASGGQGNISYAVSSPNSDVNVAMAANGNGTHLWWRRLPGAAGGFGVEIVATDEAGAEATLLLNVNILLPTSPSLVSASVVVSPFYTGPVASIAAALNSQFTVVFGGTQFAVGTDGVLSLPAAIGVGSTLITASIVVDYGTPSLTTLGYTLSVLAACSFFSGCQPLVDFDGAEAGYNSNSRADWTALSVPLAQSLIATGADVNEVVATAEDDTPLLSATRYSSLGVASVLLTAGANVNVLGGLSARFGVLHNMIFRTNNVVPSFLTLLIAHGVDVNLIRDLNGVSITPLDDFNALGFTHTLAANIIKAAGGKCLSECRNDDIPLASVSFAPATVAVEVDAATTGNLYTVQAASGLGTRFHYQIASTSPADLASKFRVIFVDTNSAILNLNSALGAGKTFSVFVEATDIPSGDKAILQFRIIPPPPAPFLVNVSVAVSPFYTGPVASIAAAPNSQFTVVFGDNNFIVGTTGILSLTARIGVTSALAATVLTASIVVDDGMPLLTTLGYTLKVVGTCSFFSGCQPFVNFDGAGAGTDSAMVWATISVPLAQSLIAAGAAVNERVSYTEVSYTTTYTRGVNNGDNTPLLAAARYGTQALASVLLANNADVNAVIEYAVRYGMTVSNMGVFYAASFFRNSADINILPLASLFLAHGADINHLTRHDDYSGTDYFTPFDIYSFKSGNINNGDYFDFAADFIKGRGGKCSGWCFDYNDIRLAPVSFLRATVAVKVDAATTGNLYTVQAVSGLGTSFDYQIASISPADLAPKFRMVFVDTNSAILRLNSALGAGRTLSVFVEATDMPSGDKATLQLEIITP